MISRHLVILLFMLSSCTTVNNSDVFRLTDEMALADRTQKIRLITESNGIELKEGAQYDKALSIFKNICTKNNIEVCPNLIIKDSSAIDSPTATTASVVITKGFIDKIDNDDQLAFIMAHEITHILNGDAAKLKPNIINDKLKSLTKDMSYMKKYDVLKRSETILNSSISGRTAYNYGTTDALLYAVIGSLLLNVGGGLVESGLYSFNRNMEYKADINGVKLMASAGYDPKEAIKFWGNASNIFGEDMHVFSTTHPSYSNRSSTLKNIINKN